MSLFIDKIREITGTTLDPETGDPIDGMWADVKKWYTELLSQDSKFSSYLDGSSEAKDLAEAAADAAKVSETNAKTSETNAKNSEEVTNADYDLVHKYVTEPEDTEVESGTYSTVHWLAKLQKEKWIAEAYKMTAQSYATAPVDTFVTTYESNGDGTFTATVTNVYSALHYNSMLQDVNLQNIVVGSYPTVDPAISGRLWNNNGVLTVSAG